MAFPFDIHSNRPMAIVLIVVGALLALISILTSQVFSIVAGIIIAILGTLSLVNPVLRIQPHEVQLRNPLGMTLKRFPLTSPADLRIEGKKLIHAPANKKIVTLGFGVDKGDVDKLRHFIAGGHGYGPGPGQGGGYGPGPGQGGGYGH